MTFVVLAAVWLTGFGLLRGMFPRPFGWSLHNVVLLSLGIGAGAGIASCLWFLSLLLAGPSFAVLASVTAGAAVAALAFAILTRRQGTLLVWAAGPEVPWYLHASFLLAIALAAATFLILVIANPHGEQGAWSIWNLHARFLFRGGAFWRDAFSNDIGWSHPDYPLLVPGLIALCWKLAGHESTTAPIAIALLFTLGTAGLLTSALGVLRGKTQALAGGTLLLGTAGFLALGGAEYGDVPLSFYILATLALLCLQDRHPEDLRFSALAGLMAGFAAWTRNDGIIFLCVLIAARVAIRTPVRQMLRLFAGLAAPLAVVLFFKLRVAGASDWSSETRALVLHHLADPGRWIVTIEGLVVVLFNLGTFLIPIVLVLALYWYLVRFQIDIRDRAALASGAIALALTLAVQLLADILFAGDLAVEINTAFERDLLQLWPAGLLLFFVASAPLQLTATAKAAPKAKISRKAPKPARRTAETR